MDPHFYTIYNTPEQRTRAFETLQGLGYKFIDRFGNPIKLSTFNRRHPIMDGDRGVFIVNIPFKQFHMTSIGHMNLGLKIFNLTEDLRNLVRYCKSLEKRCVWVKNVGSSQNTLVVTPTNVLIESYDISYSSLRHLERAIRKYKITKEIQPLRGFTVHDYTGSVFPESFNVGCQRISHKKWRQILEVIRTVAPKKYAMIVR